MVTISAWFSGASASADTVYTLPSGFRPTKTERGILPEGTTANTSHAWQMLAAGGFSIYNYGTGAHYLERSYRTNDAWPTSLPGSASGSIPSA